MAQQELSLATRRSTAPFPPSTDPGFSQLLPCTRGQAGVAKVQSHLPPASSQLGRATGLVRLGHEKLPVFRSDLCCV